MDQHNGETNVQVVHFIDSRFPVFDFHWILTVSEDHNLACPSLLAL